MSKFKMITLEVLTTDQLFVKYLTRSQIQDAKKGGTFVGNYEVAPEIFRKYGIILPKGGMIIPDAEPAQLKDILVKAREVLVGRSEEAIKVARAERENAKQIFLAEVTQLLSKYGIPGLRIVECTHETNNPSLGAVIMEGFHGASITSVEVKTLLAFGTKEAAFLLRSERGPDRLVSSVQCVSIEEVEAFLATETQVYSVRQQFLHRLQAIVEKNREINQHRSSQEAHDDRIRSVAYGNCMDGDSYFYPFRPGITSAHELNYRKKRYKFREEDVAELEQLVMGVERIQQDRFDRLWRLFVQTQGVLTTRQEDRWDEDGSYKENVYFVNGERLSPEEYKWLQGRLSEIPAVGVGFFRVLNSTNDILRIPDLPGQNDVLVVVGKTGSRRREWSYGEWFRGHPSKCEIDFSHRNTAWKIQSVTLNGQVQSSNSVELSLWTEPSELAKRALQEAGIEPTTEKVSALAEVYAKIRQPQ